MKIIALSILCALTAAVRLTDAPAKAAAKEEKPKINQFDGLIHKDGKTFFPGGGEVNFEAKHDTFKGPVPSIYTSENGGAMRVVDIVQSQGNGHVGGVWPYREDTTGVQKAKVKAVRGGW